MRLLLGIVITILVAASFFADYKWKQWVARQQAARQHDPDNHRT